jgi:RNA polymerase sigma-70 factor (ECF subfamily)
LDEIAALLEPEIPALRRYAFALLRDREAADDLVQDTLERALSRWLLRHRGSSLRAWLFTIQHNLFIDQVRQRRRRGVQVGEEALERMAEPSAPSGRDVLDALDILPDEQRAVLLLVGVEDMTYEEAARVLAIPVGTVMSRLNRGRDKLRLIMGREKPTAIRRVK